MSESRPLGGMSGGSSHPLRRQLIAVTARPIRMRQLKCAAIAAVVGAVLLTSSCATRGVGEPPLEVSKTLTTPPVDAGTPATLDTLDDLPAATSVPEVVWVDDGVLHLSGREVSVTVGSIPTSGMLAQLVWSPDGRIIAVDRETGVKTLVAVDAAGPPVASGSRIAWPSKSARGSADAVVVLADYEEDRQGRVLPRPEVTVLDQQVLPAPCCDDMFSLRAMTQFYTVLANSSAGPWAWGTAEGQEGVPYAVPDSSDFIKPLADSSDAVVAQATTKVVVRDADRYSFFDDPFGNQAPGPTRPVRLGDAVLDPSARLAAITRQDGIVAVQDLAGRTSTTLGLPADPEVRATWWTYTGAEHELIVDLVDTEGRRGLVLCADSPNSCRLALRLPITATVAVP